ncbi:MAG: 4Fe-4S dicluster domain-containing protein [Clostridia bacterium]|nr:4Fe-4S dicluster domain-containing protein [Clostridia bacterium]
MRKCALSALPAILSRLAESRAVYLPADGDDGCARFTRYAEGMAMSNALLTVRSAKDLFFPQTEDMVGFRMEGKQIEILDIRKETEDFVVFGMRACDVRSLAILDRVFLSEPVDSFYAARRAHGVVVSMACDRPAETCFCHTFGIDPAAPQGDVVCVKTADGYYFTAHSDKGAALLGVVADLTEEADPAAVESEQAAIRQRMEKLPLHTLTADAFGSGKTATFFDAPAWDTLSAACLGCGTCTFVCPTCQCYDIRDFDTGHGIRRFRCWDSCMYSDFTQMSAGQPRLTQSARFRQRFMHKLVYFPENNDGMFGCVGCGRCLKSCPISMNIVKVMKTLGGNAHE